jgi:hypothetical protein
MSDGSQVTHHSLSLETVFVWLLAGSKMMGSAKGCIASFVWEKFQEVGTRAAPVHFSLSFGLIP